MEKEYSFYARLSLSFEDIGRCQKYAQLLLTQAGGKLGSEERLINESLRQAAVVSYGRVFNKSFPENKDHAQFVKFQYEQVVWKFNDRLSEPERSLHARMLAMRDQVFAHSDAQSRGWQFSRCSPIAVGRNPFYPMENDEVRGLIELTQHAVDVFSNELSSWNRRLFEDSHSTGGAENS